MVRLYFQSGVNGTAYETSIESVLVIYLMQENKNVSPQIKQMGDIIPFLT